MWNGVFPAISVNKGVTIISDFGPPCELLSPSGTQKGEKWLQAMNSQLLAAIVSEELRVWIIKNQVLAPHSWDAYKRNDFSKTRLSHLSIHRKTLNSLTWNIWFSLINCNLLIFRPPAPCCKLLCNLTPPPPTVLSGSLEILSLGLEVLKIPTK